MFSIADMAVAGAVALLLFGPDQLPKVARRAGQLVRDVQNTSQSFIREMERAADDHDRHPAVAEPVVPPSVLSSAPAYHETPAPAPHGIGAPEGTLDPQSFAADSGVVADHLPSTLGPELAAFTARPASVALPHASTLPDHASQVPLAEPGSPADAASRARSDASLAPGQPAP